jgi:energy-coupling factor transporter ATP-binding protein EcfA2
LQKNLKSNGWFQGGHTVRLNDGSGGIEISDEKQLEQAIDAEKAAILNNEELQKAFAKVDNALSNAELRAFREYIVQNPTLLPELKNYAYLKNKLWVGYLQKLSTDYVDLVECYDRSQQKLRVIVGKAEAETTRWEGVLEIFNTRFSVPFKVAIENKSDAVLGISSPQIVFYFDEANNGGRKKVDKALLDRVLSNGERRALYILNIIFEVEARRTSGIETIFLVDDIADSFDYRNKYAIIEYLSDMRHEEQFRLVIMTHNFDLYRTARSRLGVFGSNKLLASRERGRISLRPDNLSQNPFLHWRDNLNDRAFVVATIPFVRNLAEYTGEDEVYQRLTSLLHVKTGSQDITLSNVKELFGRVLPEDSISSMHDSAESTLDVIFDVCDGLAAESEDLVALHEKVVLAIGIRLKAEAALIKLINDEHYIASISSNQTGRLIRRYERDNPGERATLALMKKVALMTPENIHLNSFMFEPILDMSAHHLQTLYCDLMGLCESLLI